MDSLQKYPRIVLERIKIGLPLVDERTAVRNNEKVGPKFTNAIIKNEPYSDNSYSGVVVDNLEQKRETAPVISDLVAKIKNDSTDKINVINELVACAHDSFKEEPSNANSANESNNVKICELVGFISDNIKTEPASIDDNETVFTDDNVASTSQYPQNHSSCVKLINCSVRLKDLFSNNVRRMGNAHSSKECLIVREDSFNTDDDDEPPCNRSSCAKLIKCSVRLEDLFSINDRRLGKAHSKNELCLCIYCRGEFKYASTVIAPKSKKCPSICGQKNRRAMIKLSKCKISPGNLSQKPVLKGPSGVLSSKIAKGCHSFTRKTSQSEHSNTHSRDGGNQRETASRNSASVSSLEITLPACDADEEFKCVRCMTAFKSKLGLQVHFKKKHSAPAKCELCRTTFKYDYLFIRHMADYHGNERPFKCEQCALTFKHSTSLNIHLVVHNDEQPYACDQCSKSFKLQHRLKMHMFAHTEKRPVECKKCGKKFKHKASLKDHLPSHSCARPFKCKECPGKFKTRYTLKAHIIGLHTSERPFQCKQCSATFKFLTNLKIHAQTHSDKKPYSCSLCPAKFKAKNCWKNHSLSHINGKRFECELCKKNFISKSSLQSHLMNHNSEKSFECEECSVKFKNKRNLSTHIIRCHTNERPFRCKQCPSTFKLANDLKQHLRWHGDERPHACQQCSAKFLTNKHLKRHIHRCHSSKKRFKCTQCSAMFKESSDLKTHLLVHTSKRPYQCHHCSAKFKCKKSLKRHVLGHLDKYRFQCEICKRKFTDKYQMNKHLKTHSKKLIE